MNTHDKHFMAEKIRTQYMEKSTTELDALRALDAKVKRPVHIFSYLFGSLGAIVMGSGMSLVMTDFGGSVGLSDATGVGIVIGSIGLIMAIVNYPIYKKLLIGRKRKYADRIIAISNKIVNS